MAVALQLLLLIYSPLILLPMCGLGLGFPATSDLAAALGMAGGVLVGGVLARGWPGPRWLAFLGGFVTMVALPPSGMAERLLAAEALPGIAMAMAMIPAMLAGYGAVYVIWLLVAAGRGDRMDEGMWRREV